MTTTLAYALIGVGFILSLVGLILTHMDAGGARENLIIQAHPNEITLASRERIDLTAYSTTYIWVGLSLIPLALLWLRFGGKESFFVIDRNQKGAELWTRPLLGKGQRRQFALKDLKEVRLVIQSETKPLSRLEVWHTTEQWIPLSTRWSVDTHELEQMEAKIRGFIYAPSFT